MVRSAFGADRARGNTEPWGAPLDAAALDDMVVYNGEAADLSCLKQGTGATISRTGEQFGTEVVVSGNIDYKT